MNQPPDSRPSTVKRPAMNNNYSTPHVKHAHTHGELGRNIGTRGEKRQSIE